MDKPAKRPNCGSSPFIFLDRQGNPKLDIKHYFKEKCNGETPDVITILLGINDCFGLQKKLNAPEAVDKGIDYVFANANILLKDLQQAAPKAIIGISLLPILVKKLFLLTIRENTTDGHGSRFNIDSFSVRSKISPIGKRIIYTLFQRN